MKEARFIYKCRRCGCQDESMSTALERASSVLLLASMNICTGEGIKVSLLGTHTCRDGGMGITDLQGYYIGEDDG